MPHSDKPISTYIAGRLRFDRDLALPPDAEYANPRVKEIAAEVSQLRSWLTDLDRELFALWENTPEYSHKERRSLAQRT